MCETLKVLDWPFHRTILLRKCLLSRGIGRIDPSAIPPVLHRAGHGRPRIYPGARTRPGSRRTMAATKHLLALNAITVASRPARVGDDANGVVVEYLSGKPRCFLDYYGNFRGVDMRSRCGQCDTRRPTAPTGPLPAAPCARSATVHVLNPLSARLMHRRALSRSRRFRPRYFW